MQSPSFLIEEENYIIIYKSCAILVERNSKFDVTIQPEFSNQSLTNTDMSYGRDIDTLRCRDMDTLRCRDMDTLRCRDMRPAGA